LGDRNSSTWTQITCVLKMVVVLFVLCNKFEASFGKHVALCNSDDTSVVNRT